SLRSSVWSQRLSGGVLQRQSPKPVKRTRITSTTWRPTGDLAGSAGPAKFEPRSIEILAFVEHSFFYSGALIFHDTPPRYSLSFIKLLSRNTQRHSNAVLADVLSTGWAMASVWQVLYSS